MPPRRTSTVERLDPPIVHEVMTHTDVEHIALHREPINTVRAFWCYPSNLPVFITISPFPAPSMDTRRKNKSTHPGLPDMTPSQLSSAGLTRTPAPRRKKATKDQQITALQDELRSIRELLSKVSHFTLSTPSRRLPVPLFSRSILTHVRHVAIKHKMQMQTVTPTLELM